MNTNELTLAQTSVFDSIEVFDQTMRMASALSKSAFVPKAFQNSPESCLIAIDLARRLAVSPMTIFPHLYVIDSKPAFSTQFLITLVNRSGYFERLDWETGVDGEVEVNYCDYRNGQRDVWQEKVKNHFAIARLVERRTGRIFESPKVDIAFAELNGWTSKPGSKWRTMPEIMCAYRSASILIKRICPELTLGMNFAEDVEDGAGDAIDLKRDAYVETTRGAIPALTHIPAPAAEEYVAKIDAAQTEDELKEVGAAIKTAGFGDTDRKRLSEEYKRRRDEIRDSAVKEIANAIDGASSLEALNDVKTALAALETADAIAPNVRDGLRERIEGRVKELTPKSSSKASKAILQGLRDSLAQAKDRQGIETVAGSAGEYADKGLITDKQYHDFIRECETRLESTLV